MASSASSSSYPSSFNVGRKPQICHGLTGETNAPRYAAVLFHKIQFLPSLSISKELNASFKSPKSGTGGKCFGAGSGARICPRPSASVEERRATNKVQWKGKQKTARATLRGLNLIHVGQQKFHSLVT